MPTSRRRHLVTLAAALTASTAVLAGAAMTTTAAEAPSSAAADRAPALILAKVHADWCPKCKTLDPVYVQVSASMATSDVLFVRLDRTDKATTSQAELHASALNFGDWSKFAKKTGLMVLFNPSTGQVVQEFKAGVSASEVESAIKSSL